MHHTDESLIGAWLGIGYVCACLLGWIPLDRWLHRHHHEYITSEVRELLQSGGPGPLIFCAFVGAVLSVGLFHFFYQRTI